MQFDFPPGETRAQSLAKCALAPFGSTRSTQSGAVFRAIHGHPCRPLCGRRRRYQTTARNSERDGDEPPQCDIRVEHEVPGYQMKQDRSGWFGSVGFVSFCFALIIAYFVVLGRTGGTVFQRLFGLKRAL